MGQYFSGWVRVLGFLGDDEIVSRRWGEILFREVAIILAGGGVAKVIGG